MNLLGIDHGGTATKLLLVDGDAVVDRATIATGSFADLDKLADGLLAFLAGRPVDRFGLTVAGTLDPVTQVVLSSANLRWLDGLAPAALLAERLGVPGTAVQDGAAAAAAEARLGAGRGAEDVFVVALGTGIAGAHVVNGQVRAGAAGGAGEIGHLVVTDGPLCSCRQRGCLETAIGGVQLGARWLEAGGVWS
ncbi:ROK family protein, partial [Desertihabitans aurantiacus]|uniref:ROK family protein n=1 Tax=Desertihabitans aurantiacus TaxID=2282477 RepID=UPI0013006215